MQDGGRNVPWVKGEYGDSCPLVWAFVPFMLRDGRVFGESYDTEQTKVELALAFHQLGLPWIWQPILRENLDEIVSQVLMSRRHREVVVCNFCDGTDSPLDTPGISVVHALEKARVPFTGADGDFFSHLFLQNANEDPDAAGGRIDPAISNDCQFRCRQGHLRRARASTAF